MTSLSTTAARWVEPGVLLLALTAIAQNVLSVKASLWTLTHLRYSQINSHPHSRGHEATVIWLTPSHMYTHTRKHVCKHNLLIVPGVGLEKPRTCSLCLSGFELAYFSSKRICTPFLPPSFIYETSFPASSWLVALPDVFFVCFSWSLTWRKAEQLWMTACVFSFVNADTSWAPRTVRSEDICTGESRFVCDAFVFVSSETWRFSSFIF